MKKQIELNVEPRTTGKHFSRALRRERRIPAVIYGAMENKNVWVFEGDVLRYNVRAYENALFSLKSSDSATAGKVVLIKQVDVHPVTRVPRHVDFFALDLKKTVRVSIEINFQGKPVGLAEGGLLNIVNRQIEVECLPTAIPDSITADVSGLGVGDALHVSDLKIPDGVKVLTGAEQTLAVVNLIEEEAAAAPTEAAAAAAPAAGAAAPAAGAAAPAAGAKAAAAPAAGAKK